MSDSSDNGIADTASRGRPAKPRRKGKALLLRLPDELKRRCEQAAEPLPYNGNLSSWILHQLELGATRYERKQARDAADPD